MEQLELRPGFDDKRVAVFAQAEDLAVVRPGRRREGPRAAADADLRLIVDLLARMDVEAAEQSHIVENIQVVAVSDRRDVVRSGLRLAPGNEFVGGLFLFE